MMLRVRKELCSGCGLCVEACPREAIWLLWGKAEMDQSRCSPCRLCRQVCPQGAIVELVPVSKDELQAVVTVLKQRADSLIERVERVRHERQWRSN